MRLIARRLKTGETDYELLFGILFLPLFCLASLLIVYLPDGLTPFCLLYRSTGIPCPACGSLRAFTLLIHADVAQAWLHQPLTTTLAVIGAAYVAYAWIVVLLRLPRVRIVDVPAAVRTAVVIVILTAVALNWIYLARTF